VKPVYYASFAGHGYNNQEEIVPVLLFLISFSNKEDQYSDLLRQRAIKENNLDAFIASKNVTRTVTITGTHSPEGAERINSKLSPDRAAAIEKYYRAANEEVRLQRQS
jgi:hypothetical protein